MTQEGSSRRRARSSASPAPGTRRGEETATAAARRKRFSNREDLFRNQDPQEKMRLNLQYRELQKNADRLNQEGTASASDVTMVVERADRLLDNVKDADLATLDAKLFTTATDAAANLIRKSKLSNSEYDVDELLRAIKVTLGLDLIEQRALEQEAGNDVDELEQGQTAQAEAAARRYAKGDVLGDWAKIGWMAAQLCRRVPGVEFLYGPLAVEHTKRVVGPRARNKDVAPEVRPKEIVAETQNKSKDITAHNVRVIGKVLEKLDSDGEGVNYFRLVVNPDDYGQTIENVFYTSFLIHEGRAGITVKDDGEIIVRHRERVDPERDGEVATHQAVIELTMDDWKEAIRVFDIRRSSIPNRERPEQAPGQDGWYGAS